MGIVESHGGFFEMGVNISSAYIHSAKAKAIVNCLGINSPTGGADGAYQSSAGTCVLLKHCPADFSYYVMDDDVSAGVMQNRLDGSLYLSTGADPKPGFIPDDECTKQTVEDCKMISRALFGKEHSMRDVS